MLAPNSQMRRPIAKMHMLVKKKKISTLMGLLRKRHLIPKSALRLKPLILLVSLPKPIRDAGVVFDVADRRCEEGHYIQQIQKQQNVVEGVDYHLSVDVSEGDLIALIEDLDVLDQEIRMQKVEEEIQKQFLEVQPAEKPVSIEVFSLLDAELNFVHSQKHFEQAETKGGGTGVGQHEVLPEVPSFFPFI